MRGNIKPEVKGLGMRKKQTILITGGAGFIGFHLARHLLQQGKDIVVVDNLSDYYDPKLKQARLQELKKHGKYIFYKKDVSDAKGLKSVFAKHRFSCIFHLAAQVSVRYSLVDPHRYEQSNNLGMLNILEMARHYKITKVIYASSSSVYGGSKQKIFKEDQKIDQPISFYAATKINNEMVARTYHHLYGIQCIGLRIFTAYGPWGRPDMALFGFTNKILNGKAIDVYHFGKMQRDFTYVNDVVAGLVAASRCSIPEAIFNLGFGKPVPLLEMIRILETTLGKKAKRRMLPKQPGDVVATHASIVKAKKLLGYKPRVDLKTGIQHFVKWYLEYYSKKKKDERLLKKQKKKTIVILGGGIAGIAAGYYAGQQNLDFTVYEAENFWGGNCRTLTQSSFRFDSGAHRFHDKDPAVTAEIKQLLGKQLHEINLPSKVYDNKKLLTFPLQPYELFKHIGGMRFLVAGLDVLRARYLSGRKKNTFEAFALGTYGKVIAERFLLNYSEKLWGLPCADLSPSIAGKRLKGLGIKSFLQQISNSKKSSAQHMEGKFYYPDGGIAALNDTMMGKSGLTHFKKNARITKIFHSNNKIVGIEINRKKRIAVQELVSTLPLDVFVRLLCPTVPKTILHLVEKISFRHIRLAVFFIKRPSILKAATMYFPDKQFVFTRLYEPKNRNPKMSPKNKTSLVAEVPCFSEDSQWKMSEEKFISMLREQVVSTGIIKEQEIIGTASAKCPAAYPLLSLSAESGANTLLEYLQRFTNLHLSGRNALYKYSWIHDQMRLGKTIIHSIAGRSETTC
jgi:UDP-glucuronate 4-epimerase